MNSLLIQDNNGNTPLMRALILGESPLETLLIPPHAVSWVKLMNKDGHTALHLAAMKNDAAAIKLLLDRGADLTVLFRQESVDLLWKIFDLVPDAVNFQDDKGNTPLILMMKKNADLKHIKQLLAYKNIQVNHRNHAGEFAITSVSKRPDRAEVIMTLGQAKADLRSQDNTGNTPLSLLMDTNGLSSEWGIIRGLVAGGAPITLTAIYNGVKAHLRQKRDPSLNGSKNLDALLPGVNKDVLATCVYHYLKKKNPAGLFLEFANSGSPLKLENEPAYIRLAVQVQLSEISNRTQEDLDYTPKPSYIPAYTVPYGNDDPVFGELLIDPRLDEQPEIDEDKKRPLTYVWDRPTKKLILTEEGLTDWCAKLTP